MAPIATINKRNLLFPKTPPNIAATKNAVTAAVINIATESFIITIINPMAVPMSKDKTSLIKNFIFSPKCKYKIKNAPTEVSAQKHKLR